MGNRKRKAAEISPRPRLYGTKSRYTQEQLEEIIDDIKHGRIGQREASRKYGIPRNTFRNKIQHHHVKSVGRQLAFSPEEEKCFVNHILALSDFGIPCSLFDLRCIAKCYLDSNNRKELRFKGNMPGWEWGYSFLQRHNHELAQKLGNNLSRKRAQVNDAILKTFFDNIDNEIDQVPPGNLYNYDETAFHDNPKKKLVLFRRGCRHPQRIRNSTKSCYTTLFCGNAEGEFIPPYIIMKGSQKWSDWLYGAPPGTKLNVSKSGWIEHDIFDDWFENHFLLCVKNKVGKKVLIGDNLSSHITIRSLQLAKENDVVLIFLPPNSTNLLQPLDVAYFASLKTFWREVLQQWRETRQGKVTVALPKSVFSQLLKKTLDLGEATASQNLVKGFEKAGIFPLNRDRVLSQLPAFARSDTINDSIGEEFQRYLENIRKSDLGTVERPRKYRLPIEPGKSVSAEEVQKFYEDKNLENTRPKKPRGGPRTRGGRQRNLQLRTLCPQNETLPQKDCQSTAEGSTVLRINQNNIDRQEEDASEEVLLDYGDLNGINLSDVANEENVAPSNDTALLGNIISESENITEVHATVSGLCNEDIYLKDDFVVVKYDERLYPGQVTDIHNEHYKVRCMIKSAAYWKWPDKHDEVWYARCDIFKKIPYDCIVPVSSRGTFHINECLLGAITLGN